MVASRYGFSVDDVSNQLAGNWLGTVATDLRLADRTIPVRVRLPDESNLQGRVFFDHQQFHSTFMAVTNPTTTRNLVRLATDQNVPVNGVGSMAQWSKSLSASNVFSAGTDFRWVDGDSEEDAYVAAVPTVIVGVVPPPSSPSWFVLVYTPTSAGIDTGSPASGI